MTVGELRGMLEGVPDETPVKMSYETFAERDVSTTASGMDEDGVFWVVEED